MYGLVLEGGGAKGSYQIGVWQALRELGVEIQGVSGTSVGALNGALILQGDFQLAYDIWYNICPSKVINLEDSTLEELLKFDITPYNIHSIIKYIRDILGVKGFDITPLRNMIRENIKEDIIRKSNKDFGIVAVSLTDRKPMELFLEDIPEGELINYLIASAYLPVFKIERIKGKLYLDGGFYDNLPISLLQRKGYKDLIVVRLYGIGRTRRIKGKDKMNITWIEPSRELGGTLDFSTERARENMKIGYFDAIRVLKGYKGKKYCIEPSHDEGYYMDLLMNLGEKKILALGEILGIEEMDYRRMLFEKIVPRLADLLELDEDSTYSDIVLSLYEWAGEKLAIDPYRIYREEEFFDEVKSKFKPSRHYLSKRIPRIIKSRDLLIKKVKNEILGEVLDEFFKKIN